MKLTSAPVLIFSMKMESVLVVENGLTIQKNLLKVKGVQRIFKLYMTANVIA